MSSIDSDSSENNKQNRANFVILIPGDNRHHISAEVLFSHLRLACKDVTFNGGYTDVVIDCEGRVYVESQLVYTPKSLTAKEGVA